MGILALNLAPNNLAIVLGASALLYGAALGVYRLYFHPLAKYPGPKVAAATRWYEFYFDLIKGYGGQFAWEIDRMHQVYGPIVRINPEELHVQDPDWLDVLYTGNPTHRDKYPPFASMTGVPVATFGTIEHNVHRKRKLAMSPFFSKRSIQSAEPLLLTQAEKLCRSLHASFLKQEVVPLHTRFLGFTTDSVSQFGFNRNDGMQDDADKVEDWAETLRMVGYVFPLLRQFPWLIKVALKVPLAVLEAVVPVLSRFMKLHIEMKHQAKVFLTNELINPSPNSEKRSERPPTIFHGIYQSSLPESEKSLDRLSQEGLVMFAAGSESTSRSLMLALYYLLNNKSALESLREELRAVMPDSSVVPPVKVLESGKWLHAVVKETFRTSAIFTTRFPLTTTQTLKYQHWVIPAQTPVSMTTRSVMQDSSVFPDPETFRPERWMGEDAKRLERYYVPFSRGTRICPGMDLAYAEIHLALAMIIRRFDFELVDTVYERDIKVVRDCFLGEATPGNSGVKVRVTALLD